MCDRWMIALVLCVASVTLTYAYPDHRRLSHDGGDSGGPMGGGGGGGAVGGGGDGGGDGGEDGDGGGLGGTGGSGGGGGRMRQRAISTEMSDVQAHLPGGGILVMPGMLSSVLSQRSMAPDSPG